MELKRALLAGMVCVGCGSEPRSATTHVATAPLPPAGSPVDGGSPDEGVDPQTAPVPDAATLRRASLDLRGVLPTVEELDQLEADPSSYPDLIAAWMDDPRFGSRVRDLFAEVFLTRQDYYYVFASEYGLDNEVAFVASVGDEPLRIVSTIIEDDLPWLLHSHHELQPEEVLVMKLCLRCDGLRLLGHSAATLSATEPFRRASTARLNASSAPSKRPNNMSVLAPDISVD